MKGKVDKKDNLTRATGLSNLYVRATDFLLKSYLSNKGQIPAVIPTSYPLSSLDAEVRGFFSAKGELTDWVGKGNDLQSE